MSQARVYVVVSREFQNDIQLLGLIGEQTREFLLPSFSRQEAASWLSSRKNVDLPSGGINIEIQIDSVRAIVRGWRELSRDQDLVCSGHIACNSRLSEQGRWHWVPLRVVRTILASDQLLLDAIEQVLPRVYFSTFWFSDEKQSYWRRTLRSIARLKSVRYLEIGVFQGQSLIWVLGEWLRGKNVAATAVDSFEWGSRRQLEKNLEITGLRSSVKIIEGDSKTALSTLSEVSFDLIYVDGAHDCLSVFSDALAARQLLRPGGYLVFDDYGAKRSRPLDQRPDTAIDLFVSAARGEFKLIRKAAGQIFLKKRTRALDLRNQSQIGPYKYHWPSQKLFSGRKEVGLTKPQMLLLENLLGRLVLGKQDLVLKSSIWSSKRVKHLLRRLKLVPEQFII